MRRATCMLLVSLVVAVMMAPTASAATRTTPEMLVALALGSKGASVWVQAPPGARLLDVRVRASGCAARGRSHWRERHPTTERLHVRLRPSPSARCTVRVAVRVAGAPAGWAYTTRLHATRASGQVKR